MIFIVSFSDIFVKSDSTSILTIESPSFVFILTKSKASFSLKPFVLFGVHSFFCVNFGALFVKNFNEALLFLLKIKCFEL